MCDLVLNSVKDEEVSPCLGIDVTKCANSVNLIDKASQLQDLQQKNLLIS